MVDALALVESPGGSPREQWIDAWVFVDGAIAATACGPTIEPGLIV